MLKQDEDKMMPNHKQAMQQALGADPSVLGAALDRFDKIGREAIADAEEEAHYERCMAMRRRFKKRFGRDLEFPPPEPPEPMAEDGFRPSDPDALPRSESPVDPFSFFE